MTCFLCNKEMEDAGSYFFCSSCGLASLSTAYNPAFYDEPYCDRYLKYEGEPKTVKLMNIRKEWVLEKGYPSSVLDVGCGVGSFTRAVACPGREVYGYDINYYAINAAKKIGGSAEYGSSLQFIMGKKFETLTLFDVIEHVPNPISYLQYFMDQHLKENGRLFISTPNTGIHKINEIPKDWIHFRPEEHLHYFTEKSLLNLFRAVGFDIFDVSWDYRETEARDTYKRNILCMSGIR